MPYFVTNEHPDCSNWATVKEDGELVACHSTEQDAIDQMIAVSLSEGIEPGGTYQGEYRAAPDELEVGDFVRWNSAGGTAQGRITRIVRDGEINVPDSDFSITGTPEDPAALIRLYREGEDGWEAQDQQVGHKFSTLRKIQELRELPDNYRPALTQDVPEGRACGNCFFFNEAMVSEDGERGWCEKWEDYVRAGFYCNAWEPADAERSYSVRDVNLEPPAYMRAAARRGLRFYEEGLAGDGLTSQTVREARAMAEGNVTADKWVRIAAWIARHMDDLDAPAANPSNDDFPSAGVVAHLLWGSGVTKRAANRTMQYAEGVVSRLEEENRELVSVEAKEMAKIETRLMVSPFEVRDNGEGMTFTGYAAIFNSPSEPLPFREKIAPGAFTRSLRARNDIKLLWNHDTGSVLGSTRAGTLRLEEDGYGLRVTADLPDTQQGRDASYLIKRGDVSAMSFGFSVPAGGDEWSGDGMERTLNSVRLHEVSIVAFPAYSETAGKTMVRNLENIAKRANVNVDDLSDALLKIEVGENLSDSDAQVLTQVINDLTPQEEKEVEDAQPELNSEMLALKKKKLEQLLKGI